jgi:CRISPR/Cas system Type II protein with McrA/HNH and RuvC-like nuclease domain
LKNIINEIFMKKILGLDLGSSSVGWAFILEDEM